MDRSRHLIRSTVAVLLIYGLNKVTGLAKLFLLTSAFGTGPEADALTAANQLPELLLAMLAGGALGAALIPIYTTQRLSSHREQASDPPAIVLAHSTLTLTLLVVGAICALSALAAPWLVRVLLVPHFPPEMQELTARLMRIVLGASVLIAVSGVFTSLLHAHQRFLAPAWGTVLIDLGQIIGLAVLVPRMGIEGAAWGSVIGAFLMVGVQLPAYWQEKIGYRLRLAWRLPGLHALLGLMGPRVIALGAFQAVDLVFLRLASGLSAGSISAYFFAHLAIVGMPRSLFGHAVANVIFPSLSEQHASGNAQAFQKTLLGGLRAVWALVVPAAIGMVALGPNAVTFLFERGAFGPESTRLVYSLIAILSLRLVAEASQDVIALAFYARHDTQTPMWASLGWMVLNVGLSIALVGPLGVGGLAWASSLSAVALAAVLFLLAWRTLDGFSLRPLAVSSGQLLLAGAGMTALVLLVRRLAPPGLDLPLAIPCGIATFVLLFEALGGDVGRVWRAAHIPRQTRRSDRL